jgi:DNA-binding NarL/FixJ family response regulator
LYDELRLHPLVWSEPKHFLWGETVTLERAGRTSKPLRVLVVDDYAPWRGFVSTTLRKDPELEIVGNASDGLEAVQEAQQLQPDVVLLDIGLPKLNGLEVARRIREVSPASKILVVSQNNSADVARKALETGALGYVVKSDGPKELVSAVKAVLEGKRFISSGLAGVSAVAATLSVGSRFSC